MKSTIYVLCIALLLTGCVYKTGALHRQIARYKGDGTIIDASIGAPPFFWEPGFRLVFPNFDPAQPYEHSYRLQGVPKTKYGASTIYVCFPGDWSPDAYIAKSNVTAVLCFTVLGENGTVLKSQEIKFNTAIWSHGAGIFGLWVYDRPNHKIENIFNFDPGKLYSLKIVYAPGPTPPQTKTMYISVENGGRI